MQFKTYINSTEFPARFVIMIMIWMIVIHWKLLITDRIRFIKPPTKRLLRLRTGTDCLHSDVGTGKETTKCSAMNVCRTNWVMLFLANALSILNFSNQMQTWVAKALDFSITEILRADSQLGFTPTGFLQRTILDSHRNTKLCTSTHMYTRKCMSIWMYDYI
jgi:hypothetical protein